MLVLSRKPGQSISIGEGIRIKVVAVQGQHVRIGIEAPASVTVVREELHRAVAEANKEAAGSRERDIDSLAARLRKRDSEGRK
ncbi:MAG: carbon storage regulator CsrA [Acidobacteriota bacterium]|nr:MAG: carbon storage regulator CsrA [Acidobacteriota bacterium]